MNAFSSSIALLAALTLAVTAPAQEMGPSPAPVGQPMGAHAPGVPRPLMIGPVEGLTLGWHRAPARTAIPVGTIATFRLEVPPAANVSWEGALEVSHDGNSTMALCPVVATGTFRVEVTVDDALGTWSHTCVLDAQGISPERIRVAPIAVATGALELDERLPADELNALTVPLFKGPSIAAVRAVGPGRYRTSVDRPVAMSISVDPPEFAPLMEWRSGGTPSRLGPDYSAWSAEVGSRTVTVGPLAAEARVTVERYAVTITSHAATDTTLFPDRVHEFTAVTTPPGFEDEITWLASTKFGSATTVLGTGPTFRCMFEDVFGPLPDGSSWMWAGVKADNAVVEGDNKTVLVRTPEGDLPDICEYDAVVTTGGGCISVPGLCVGPCPSLDPDCRSNLVFQDIGTGCLYFPELSGHCIDPLNCTAGYLLLEVVP